MVSKGSYLCTIRWSGITEAEAAAVKWINQESLYLRRYKNEIAETNTCEKWHFTKIELQYKGTRIQKRQINKCLNEILEKKILGPIQSKIYLLNTLLRFFLVMCTGELWIILNLMCVSSDLIVLIVHVKYFQLSFCISLVTWTFLFHIYISIGFLKLLLIESARQRNKKR